MLTAVQSRAKRLGEVCSLAQTLSLYCVTEQWRFDQDLVRSDEEIQKVKAMLDEAYKIAFPV